MKLVSPPTDLDIRALAHATGHLAGQDVLSNYERLVHETQGLGAQNILNWEAKAELRQGGEGQGQVWLHLSLDTCLPLTCQRCLGLADIAVNSARSFRFVGTEAEALEQDEEAEEDILVLDKHFNLAQLLEDEVLMALPLVPTHEVCPVPVKLEAVDAGFEEAAPVKPNPFAVLAALQKRQTE